MTVLKLLHLSINFDNFLEAIKSCYLLLGIVNKYPLSHSHFCITPVRKQDQCYQLCGAGSSAAVG